MKKEFEKLELSEKLKETSDKFHPSILNIKKVVLLKQQLEKIVKEKNPSTMKKRN